MQTRTIQRTMATAALLLATLGATRAQAATLHTAPIQLGDGQKLVCTVVNLSGRALNVEAAIVDETGEVVTDFTRTDWDATESYIVTTRVESSRPQVGYCRVTVAGRKANVAASLQACSYDESVCGNAVPAR